MHGWEARVSGVGGNAGAGEELAEWVFLIGPMSMAVAGP